MSTQFWLVFRSPSLLVTALCLALVPAPAQAQSATAAQIAAAMDIPSVDIVSADVAAPVLEGTRGVLPAFGLVPPQAGGNLAVLSNGRAASPVNPGYAVNYDHGMTGSFFQGYPGEIPFCSAAGLPHDLTQVAVTMTVPAGVNGLAFDLNYYSRDYPEWICSQYGDGFAAILERAGTATNISVDALGNAIVSNAVTFAETAGSPLLQGTGFEDEGATGWLTSQAAVYAGETVTLRLYVWDSGDGIIDSTVLLDNFRWLTDFSGGGGGGGAVTASAGPDVTVYAALGELEPGNPLSTTFLADVAVVGGATGANSVSWSKASQVLSNNFNLVTVLGIGSHTLTFTANGPGGQASDTMVVTVVPLGGGDFGGGGGGVGPVGPAGPQGPQGEKGDTGEKGEPGSVPSGTVVLVMPGDPAPAGYTLIATFKQTMDFSPSQKGGGQKPVEVRVYRKN